MSTVRRSVPATPTAIGWCGLVFSLLAACAGPPRQASTPQSQPIVTQASPPSTHPSDAELLALPDPIPTEEPRARLGNPAFYAVAGQRYTVLSSARNHVERGVASWYGPNFHGERTSVGEPYNMYAMTAAHRVLPLPAYARVTNLKNGRSIVVRINDRGPFKANRIIDLSYAAALKLDMIREGTALVELRVLTPSANAPPPPPIAPLYAQVGAFTVESNAQRVLEQLNRQGIQPAFIQHTRLDASDLYRVRVGPLDSVARFDALVDQLHSLGLKTVALAPN